MRKPKNRKLTVAIEKKIHSDQSWQRIYDKMPLEIDIESICVGMEICNMADAILLQEERVERERKIHLISTDESSIENIQLDLERTTKLRFVEELLKTKGLTCHNNINQEQTKKKPLLQQKRV